MRTHRILLALIALAALAPAIASAQEYRVHAVMNRGILGFYSEPVHDAPMHQRVIVDVVAESPAAKAGVMKGDTLLRINGLAASPQVMSAPFEPGDTVVLRIRRDGRERDLTVIAAERTRQFQFVFPDSVDERFAVTVGRVFANVDSARAMPGFIRRFGDDSTTTIIIGADTMHIRAGRPPFEFHPDSFMRRFRSDELPHMFSDSARVRFFTPGEGRIFRYDADSNFVRGFDIMTTNAVYGMRAVAGAELAPLNPALAEYFGATDGVLVLNAAERTPAERAGLRGGDVIVRAGDTTVRSIAELRRAIDAARDGDVTLRVLRHGRNVDVTLKR
jgi:membrane-associated protease RseP (regulator of RpoE activity)